MLSGANEHDIRSHDLSWSSIIIKRPNSKEVKQNACEDKAYDSENKRNWLKKKGYEVHIPHRGVDAKKYKGDKRNPARRWVVERTGRWHNLFRGLKIRYTRKWENYEALVHFANAIICFRVSRS